MDIRNELIYDFGINMPRILISGKTAIIDNVKKLAMVSDTQIIALSGSRYAAITGRDMVIKQLEDERMLITGEIERVEFYGALQEGKD